LIIGISFSCKKIKKWRENVEFSDLSQNSIELKYTNNKRFGARHGFSIGFGFNPKILMKFIHKGKHYEWKGVSSPIILNLHENQIFMVTFNNHTKGELGFHFHKYSDKWIKISPESFPKNIAIQNMGLSKNAGYLKGEVINEFEMVKSLNCDYSPFQSSFTAMIWLQLEKGILYQNLPDFVDPEFLKEYKRKYIQSK
jgi:hypothetical protein